MKDQGQRSRDVRSLNVGGHHFPRLTRALERTRALYPTSLYRRLIFLARVGYWPNLSSPRSFNEKICWLKMNFRDPRLVVLADKLRVRGYVAEQLGVKYLPELYWEGTRAEDIPYDSLPEGFVLKANHGSGQVAVVRNKAEEDSRQLRELADHWLRKTYGVEKDEWMYEQIRPRLFAEEFLSDGTGGIPADFKFFVCNGVVRMIQVDLQRFESHSRNLYSPSWEKLPVTLRYPIGPDVRRPRQLELMLEVASTLARDFPFCRVDQYVTGGRVIVGECTFFPESGMGVFRPRRFDWTLGEMLDLGTVETSTRTHPDVP
jgi:hypothetical protein